MSTSKFRDREDAAIRLASALDHYRGQHPLVLGIPRGGVPMARIVADQLEGDLDAVLVRKLGAPGNPELAIGAVDEHGTVMLNRVAGWAGADDDYIRSETRRQRELMQARRSMYGAGHASLPVQGRTVIVIDDGLATGATMISALRALRAQHPSRLVCAVPVAASESLAQVRSHADETICLYTPEPFHAVGMYYEQFGAVEDADVVNALQRKDMDSNAPTGTRRRLLQIPANGALLDADLVVPDDSLGLVLFAHGSGSSRRSVRNRQVAEELQRHGIATLLMDLLTAEEDADRSARFDIRLLTERLEAALRFVHKDPDLEPLPKGLFGASTGAAAALSLAAARAGSIAAVVSRGGRPDLAGTATLHAVLAPTLLIVGGADPQVLELNRMARTLMGPRAELVVVPGASHLFEEPGSLESVADQAAQWFVRWFGAASPGHDQGTAG